MSVVEQTKNTIDLLEQIRACGTEIADWMVEFGGEIGMNETQKVRMNTYATATADYTEGLIESNLDLLKSQKSAPSMGM